MKKVVYSIIAIITVLMMTSAANIVMAAGNELENQNFFDAISNNGATAVNGITYNSTTPTFTMASGSYTLNENISLSAPITVEAGKTVTINLNGKNITAATSDLTDGVIINKGNLTITGTGTISGYAEKTDWGTMQTPTLNNDKATVTITGGTFSGHVYVKNGATATIKAGTFTAKSNDAMYILDGSTANISGGSFTSEGAAGLLCENWESTSAINTVNVSGKATFTGESAGLWVNTTDKVTLAGGTYTGKEIGGIVTFKEDAFSGFLSSKYKYSEELKVTKNSIYSAFGTQSPISVVAESSSSENTNSESSEETNSTPAEEAKETKTFEEAAKEQVDEMIDKIIAGREVPEISDELAEKIRTAHDEGKNIKVEVKKPEVKEETIKEDANKVKNFIATDSKVAAYFNIEIVITIDGEKAGNVTELKNKVTIALPIPAGLPAIPEGYERVFAIVKIHNGVVSEVDTKVSGKNAICESKEFSTYALTYTDVIKKESEEATTEETTEENTTNETKTSNPKTGDDIMFYVITLIVAGVAGAILAKRAKQI